MHSKCEKQIKVKDDVIWKIKERDEEFFTKIEVILMNSFESYQIKFDQLLTVESYNNLIDFIIEKLQNKKSNKKLKIFLLCLLNTFLNELSKSERKLFEFIIPYVKKINLNTNLNEEETEELLKNMVTKIKLLISLNIVLLHHLNAF